MIAAKSHTADWIKEQSSSLGKKIDIKLMEKVIKAFSLLEQLRTVGVNLIFKGGTCLILLSEKPKRFSIDISGIEHVFIHEGFERPEDKEEIKI